MLYSPKEIKKRLLKMGYTPSEVQEKLFKKALYEFNKEFAEIKSSVRVPLPIATLKVETFEDRIEFTKAWNAYKQDYLEP